MNSLTSVFLVLMHLLFTKTMSEIWPVDQATTLWNHILKTNSRRTVPVGARVKLINNQNFNYLMDDAQSFEVNEHLVKGGLPGQPDSVVNFKQYAGNLDVDESSGRSLFYYFVESPTNSTTKPLILWLNGGPGCSSLGLGAFTEIGPFGVNPDGQTLYEREFAWNQVANVLFLESPAGVGFSYSNTTSEYTSSTNEQTTAENTYVFLLKWFQRYPVFKGRDLYLIGESYAGYYIPELADIIVDNLNTTQNATPVINLKGIMIGNGLIDDRSDTMGRFDFALNHYLMSRKAHEELREKCPLDYDKSPECSEATVRINSEMGDINYLDLYRPQCVPAIIAQPPTHQPHPCDILYTQRYLNRPDVQAALHANTTNLPYPWQPCSLDRIWFKDNAETMFPIYRRLLAHRLPILLYSGDTDPCVPPDGTIYALERMGLDVIKPWQMWMLPHTTKVAGYMIVYDGITYATVLGAGHEVSTSRPDKLFYLLNNFLSK